MFHGSPLSTVTRLFTQEDFGHQALLNIFTLEALGYLITREDLEN